MFSPSNSIIPTCESFNIFSFKPLGTFKPFPFGTVDDSFGKTNINLNAIFTHTAYNLEKSRYDLFLENAVDDGYLKGVSIRNINSVALANPRLTSSGLRHLENNCKV